jgi:hypothetical protein
MSCLSLSNGRDALGDDGSISSPASSFAIAAHPPGTVNVDNHPTWATLVLLDNGPYDESQDGHFFK